MLFYHIKSSLYVTASPALVTQQAVQITKKANEKAFKTSTLSTTYNKPVVLEPF